MDNKTSIRLAVRNRLTGSSTVNKFSLTNCHQQLIETVLENYQNQALENLTEDLEQGYEEKFSQEDTEAIAKIIKGADYTLNK